MNVCKNFQVKKYAIRKKKNANKNTCSRGVLVLTVTLEINHARDRDISPITVKKDRNQTDNRCSFVLCCV